jgi:hypothetical protein
MSEMIAKLEKLDRRIIYLVLVLSLLVVLLRPVGLPIPQSAATRRYYDAITSLPPRSRVLLEIGFDAGTMPEDGPMLEATMKLLLKTDVKWVMVSLWVGGPLIGYTYLNRLKSTIDSSGKQYGQDFVLTPYLAGGETAAAALAKDFKGTVKTDYYGTDANNVPVLKDITGAKDFDLVILISSGTPGVDEYLRQWVRPYNSNMIIGALGVAAPG